MTVWTPERHTDTNIWKWLFIGSMVTLFVIVFSFISVAIVWYG